MLRFGHRGSGAFDGFPDGLVEHLLVNVILLCGVLLAGLLGHRGFGGVERLHVIGRTGRLVGSQVGLIGEGGGHRGRKGVELGQRTYTENALHCVQHRYCRVKGGIDPTSAGIWADDLADGAMRVDVVGAVLGIVLSEEDRGVLPDGGMGYGLDELADGLIVVCDVGLGSRDPDFGGLGVVVTETNQLDRRYASLSELFIEVGLPLVNTRFWPAAFGHRREGPSRIRAVQGPADEVVIGVRIEDLLVDSVSLALLVERGVEAVIAEADVVFRQVFPEV